MDLLLIKCTTNSLTYSGKFLHLACSSVLVHDYFENDATIFLPSFSYLLIVLFAKKNFLEKYDEQTQKILAYCLSYIQYDDTQRQQLDFNNINPIAFFNDTYYKRVLDSESEYHYFKQCAQLQLAHYSIQARSLSERAEYAQYGACFAFLVGNVIAKSFKLGTISSIFLAGMLSTLLGRLTNHVIYNMMTNVPAEQNYGLNPVL